MRTTIIPAQVTTVEDTIAGNFNLTQIVLFVSSLLANTFIYALVPKQLSFSLPKIVLILMVFALFLTLAIRIKQRLILNWLIILAGFSIRPHIYLFNKNSLFAREVIRIEPVKKNTKKASLKKTDIREKISLNFDYQSVLRSPSINLNFKNGKILVAKTYDQT